VTIYLRSSGLLTHITKHLPMTMEMKRNHN
jgi:hypothetical protein